MSTEPLPGVGSRIGSYRVDALLGRGGMGVVYRAEDLRLGRMVALKVLRASLAEDPVYRERFLRESRLAASIEHAGIVPVYEAGEADGLLYIAMRLVDGVDLAELLRRQGPLEPGRAVVLVGQLASALDAAHARGLVHRDVKASNALIGADGDGEHAYLVDFGITQDTASGERLTATDQLVGTLDYLAPERIRGEAADSRADIYALGCVLFECLTGSLPFTRTSEAATIYAHLEEPPPRPSDLRGGVPDGMDDVVARALAKDPADRWQSGAELRAAAQRALTAAPPAQARAPGRALVAAAVLAALALAATGAWLGRGGDGPSLASIEENAIGVIDAGSGRLTEQFKTGRGPEAIAAGGGSLWVANRLDGTLSRIPHGRSEVVTIDVGGEPTGLAYGAGSLWVADGQGRTVAQVAPETNRVVQRIDVGNAASAVAVGYGAIWVASAVDATVTRVGLKAGGAKKSIPVDARPTALAAGAGSIWVASEGTGRLIRLDPRTGTPLASIPVGNGPSAIAVGPGAVWVANRTDGTVSRIDPVTEIAETRRTGLAPRGLVADRQGVWVANSGDETVKHFDSRSLQETQTINVGSSPAALALMDGEVWAATTAAAATHRGGTLRLSLPASPDGYPIDPLLGGPIQALLFDSLVGYRRAGGAAGGALVAGLATAVPDSSPDGLTYLFRLRPNVRFSTGAPVTPEDVRASLERILALSDPELNDDLSAIRGAKGCTPKRCDLSKGLEIDQAARTVALHLSRPDPDILHKLNAAFVIPASSPREPQSRTPLPGTGPYMVSSWDPLRGGRLVRNPHFRAWSADRPDGFPDRIEIRFDRREAQAGEVDRGAADVATFDFGTSVAGLRARYGARLHTDPAPQTLYVFLDVQSPPFDDVRVRRALNYAIDRGHVAELLGSRETYVPTCQLLPPGFPGYTPACPFTANPNPAGTWTGPDLDRARRLVTSSGTRGMKVEFWGSAPWQPIGHYFASLLRKLGYRASVRTVTDLHLIGEAAAGPRRTRPHIGLWGWLAISAAAHTFIAPIVSCSGVVNLSHFCDRGLDALIERAASAKGLQSVELWRQVEADLAAQAPTVPLHNQSIASVAGPRVGNWQHHPVWGVLLEQLWVK
jgi:ABC-type transport system substrate-binding protein/DNA-binding beta-propeller fold protein YncE